MVRLFVFTLLRNVQEVQLDKHVKLLDSPGIVMDSGTSDSSIILRNCVKVHMSDESPYQSKICESQK